MQILLGLPMFLLMVIVAALAMFIPAAVASVTNHHQIAQNFFYSALLILIVTSLLAMATTTTIIKDEARRVLLTMLGAVMILPLIMALPFALSVPDTGLFNAWWEMVSSFTTTGASLYAADLLPLPLHLWRGIVGWFGGLMILITAIAILAPLKVGGFEILSSPYGRQENFVRLPLSADQLGRPKDRGRMGQMINLSGPSQRFLRYAIAIFPVYAGLTVTLWIILLMLGDPPILALSRAMGTLSTSGISPVQGSPGQISGIPGEMAIFAFLILSLSRRFWPGGGELRASETLWTDPELRMGLAVVAMVTLILFARHYLAEVDLPKPQAEQPFFEPLKRALIASWGSMFNALSFLTTTGWNSVDWQGARTWSGLSTPGLMLAGLAMMGGGVATTAGGVKLLRVYALARQGERELERMIHPSSIAGGGRMSRRLRREGAYLSFIFFMLFAISIALTVSLVSIHQIEFETATILSIAALTNTGQLAGSVPLMLSFEGSAGIASAPWEGWSGLSHFTKAVLAGAMIVGRLEVLAILALFSGEFWRK